MGGLLNNIFKPKPTLAEIEEENERTAAEVSLLEQKVLKRELDKRLGAGSVNKFKDENGKISWQSIKNFVKSH